MLRLFFISFYLIPFFFFSQIKGVLLDQKSQEPLAGAKIILSSGQKTQTTINGQFEIKPTSYPVLVFFSFTGYTTDSLKITQDTTFTKFLFEESVQIKTIVVTAGRRLQEIEEVPISMEIIKPELVNNKGFSSLDKAVDQSPGVYAMDGQVSIRGGGGYAYGAGSRVMLLWNGIPMLSPDIGDAKWNAVPLEQASQIEILKGASSVLYGSGALNGIIALTEKEPPMNGNLKVKFQSGVYDNPKRKSMKWWDKNPTFHLADIYYGKSYKKIGYSIGANAYLDSGYKQGANEKRLRINGSLFYKPSKLPKLRAGISYNAQFQDVGIFVLWKNDSMGYQPLDNTLSRQKAIRINVDPYLKFFDKKNNKHFFRSRYYLVTTGNGINVYDASIAQMFYFDYQFQKKLSEFTNLSAGLTNSNGQIQSWVFGDHSSINSAAYGQIETKTKKIDFSLGIRFEYCKLNSLDEVDSKFKISENKSIPVYPIFRAGMHYEMNKYAHWRASIGQGIRFPSIAERFVSTSVGGLIIFKNPELRPEKGWSSEIGYKQVVKIGDSWKGFFDIAGFLNEYNNMTEFTFGLYKPDSIETLQLTDPNAVNYFFKWLGFQAQNAERARITGIEVSFNSQGKIGDIELTSLIGYTYMNPISLNNNPTYRKTFSDTNSNILKYRFNHLVKLDIEASYKSFTIGISGRYNSYIKNIDKVFLVSVEEILTGNALPPNVGTYILPGLQNYRNNHNRGSLVIDLRASFKFYKEAKINFIINNILNAENVTRPGDIQAPRNFILQLQYSF